MAMTKTWYGSALKIIIDFRVDGPRAEEFETVQDWLNSLNAYIKAAAEDLEAAADPEQRKMLVLEYTICLGDSAKDHFHIYKSLNLDFSGLESEFPGVEVFKYTWEEPERPINSETTYAPVGQNWRLRWDDYA